MNGYGIKTISLMEGYVISEFRQIMDAEEALDLLGSEKQYECTSVSKDKNGENFTFIQHRFFCNSCNQRTPAYRHFFSNEIPPLKLRFDDVQKWVVQNAALPGIESDEVTLYEPLGVDGILVCPKCGKALKHYNRDNISIIVKSNEDMVSVTCAYDKNCDMVKNERISAYAGSDDPESDRCYWMKKEYIYETISFDLKQAKVYTTYNFFGNESTRSEAKGTRIASMGFSALIDENAFLRCVLLSSFKSFWKRKGYEKFPFKENELDSAKFVLLTKFVGYDKIFYERVQMLMDDKRPPETTGNEVGLRLHYKVKNEKIYAGLGLPQEENIKNVVLKSPEYMFYYELIKGLYEYGGAEALFEFFTEEPKCFDLLWKFSTFEQEVNERYEAYQSRGGMPFRRNSKTDKLVKKRLTKKVYDEIISMIYGEDDATPSEI